MNNSILKNLLVALPIYSGLTDDEFEAIAAIGQRQEHGERDFLYGSNNPCDGAILMSAGRAIIQPVGSPKPDIWARRGMLIHELSLFSDKIYQHNVISMEAITTYHFERYDFMLLMSAYPAMNKKIQKNIASRLTKFGAAFG